VSSTLSSPGASVADCLLPNFPQSVELLGWSSQTVAVSLLSFPLILTAQTVMSLGSAAQPLVESVAVTVVGEIKVEAISQELERIEADTEGNGEHDIEEITQSAAASVERICNVESIIASFSVVQAVSAHRRGSSSPHSSRNPLSRLSTEPHLCSTRRFTTRR
jgi:hypothetical protein